MAHPEWKLRGWETWTIAQDPDHPNPRAQVLDVGDTVVLYLASDVLQEEAIFVRVQDLSVGASALIWGVISRANRPGACSDEGLALGAQVAFEQRHVFQLQKAAVG